MSFFHCVSEPSLEIVEERFVMFVTLAAIGVRLLRRIDGQSGISALLQQVLPIPATPALEGITISLTI